MKKLETMLNKIMSPNKNIDLKTEREDYSKKTLEELEFIKIDLEVSEEWRKQHGYLIALLSPMSLLLGYTINKNYEICYIVLVLILFTTAVLGLARFAFGRFQHIATERRIVDLAIQDKKSENAKIELHPTNDNPETVNQP